MAGDFYNIIASDGYAEYKEKGSKFLAYAFHVKNIEEVETRLLEVRKLQPKARHHCYSYKLDTEGLQFRINDDGEPSGTAGKPIFGQIESASLYFTLIVVVRYFGGTKLGANGLIRAYKTSSRDAIEAAGVKQQEIRAYFSVSFKVQIMNEVMRVIRSHKYEIHEQNYATEYQLICSCLKSEKDAFVNSFVELYQVEIAYLYIQ